ncbi:porin family protein [Ferruginibacter paludis]|uniref:porin family protein n=1 Tax=Ferruginibacter paludis TaxID=1310417 RepID=UPI0025B531D6|nr:porin family protein [Ferruginibacter paludis]MDN3655594.1 porin family protein [Ferruginibacter paludis]
MKIKLLFLAMAALIFTAAANAQSVHLGVKVGTNINKISGKSFSEQFNYGYHVGGFAEIGLGKKFSLQPEVLFNQINTDTSSQLSKIYSNINSSKISNIKLSYLSIPVLLDYKLSKFFAIQAGPQFGVLINQNEKLVQNGKDAFKKGDLSMLAGVQLHFGNFRVYGRYAVGLSNINDIDNKDKWRSQSIQAGIGLTFF